uniref:PIH1D1/2/3 CS-like domain-containing protein n=1 Tax=Physcomitrium patens TaxID=3218 RepID=A0A7I4FF41_PHYPA
MMNFSDIKALEALFSSSSGDEIRDYSEPQPEALNPGHIGPQYSKNVKGGEEDEKSLVDFCSLSYTEQELYAFVYKQAVSCNDVYMQMSEKDCGSLSCEELVMKVKLPGTDGLEELDLDVHKTYLKLVSPQYYLCLHLPHKVNMERSFAKWDPVLATLIVTMPIIERDWMRRP